MSCYDNIIGLSRADCPCVNTAPPSNYTTSTSGLFMSDVPPFNEMEGFEDCGTDSIWDVLTKSRSQAITAFIADSNSALLTNFESRRERFKGQIGEASARQSIQTDKTYVAARLAFNPLRGGSAKITAIGTCGTAAGTIHAYIYNSLNTMVWEGDLETINGFKINTLATAIVLPTYIDFDDKHEYFLVYEHDSNAPLRANTIGSCGGCGFYPYFDLADPQWKGRFGGGRAWANWVMVGGWRGDTLTDFDNQTGTGDTCLNGLAIQMEVGCDIGAVLCNGSLDFTTDPLALSIAFAIQWKACDIAAALILGSTRLTRAATTNREFLLKERAEWQSKYAQTMQYIAQEAALGINDCLQCKNEHGFRVDTVWS